MFFFIFSVMGRGGGGVCLVGRGRGKARAKKDKWLWSRKKVDFPSALWSMKGKEHKIRTANAMAPRATMGIFRYNSNTYLKILKSFKYVSIKLTKYHYS